VGQRAVRPGWCQPGGEPGEVRSRSSLSHWVAGGSSPCSACLRRVLGLQAGDRLRILCSELAREPLVLVVSGVSGSQGGPCIAFPAGPVVGAGRGRLRRFSGGPGPGPLVQVVVVELRAPGPHVTKPPRCFPGAANRYGKISESVHRLHLQERIKTLATCLKLFCLLALV
jgi:hypothetical protein